MAMSKERWSQELPDDILQSIAQRLYISDYQVFRQVCPNWRAAVDRGIATRSCLPASQPPWLLLLDSPGIWSRPTDTSWPLVETRYALVYKDLEIIDRKLYVVGIRDGKYTVLLEFDILPEDDNDVTKAKYNCSISIGIPINWNERPSNKVINDKTLGKNCIYFAFRFIEGFWVYSMMDMSFKRVNLPKDYSSQRGDTLWFTPHPW
ncbi:hypothetical protein ACLB2K_061896 [Fragaria x ananassa]